MSENPATLKIVEGNNKFTTNLYKVLSKEEGNVFFSPISVHAVLSMVYQGAKDTTAQHFEKVLGVPEAKIAGEGYNEIINRLNSIKNVTLHMANKVYLMEGFELLTDFASAVTEYFLSDVQLVNFAENAAAAKTINTWVEEKTCEKIKDLIKEDDLDKLTRLVLVNAIYFKGSWKYSFHTERTRIEPFYLNKTDSVDVQMMHIEKMFNYKQDKRLHAQILEMPYTNEDVSMIIILPNKKNGIGDLEKKLATTNLSHITKEMSKTLVNVTLPKFKVEQTIDLKDALIKLGLGEIFNKEKANFRGMIDLKPNENLYVSKVVQKSFIEVNEEGAEAAAATAALVFVQTSSRATFITPPSFVADHPFIFLLMENPGRQGRQQYPLFAGRIRRPSQF